MAAGVVVAALLWPAPAPTPTAAPFGVEVVAAAPPAAGPTGQPGLQSADPEPYLNALRAAAVPVSVSGQAEVEAAAAICDQLQRGVDPAELARAVPAMLSTLTPEQAPLVVELAAQHYCH